MVLTKDNMRTYMGRWAILWSIIWEYWIKKQKVPISWTKYFLKLEIQGSKSRTSGFRLWSISLLFEIKKYIKYHKMDVTNILSNYCIKSTSITRQFGNSSVKDMAPKISCPWNSTHSEILRNTLFLDTKNWDKCDKLNKIQS